MADKAPAPVKPVIVEATGTAAARGGGPSGLSIEQAMAEATTKAYADGIIDPDEIRKRKLEARQRVKDEMASKSAPSPEKE